MVARQQPPSSRLPWPPTRSSCSAAPRSVHQPPAAPRSRPAAAHPRRAARSSRRDSMRRRPARLDAPPPAGLRARCAAPPPSRRPRQQLPLRLRRCMHHQRRTQLDAPPEAGTPVCPSLSHAQNEKGVNFPPSRALDELLLSTQRIFWDILKNRHGSNGTGRFTDSVKNQPVQPVFSGSIV